MGAAKNRGTREERIAQSQRRAEADRICEERAKACRARQRSQDLAALPPETRIRVLERRRVNNLRRTQLLVALAALSFPVFPLERPSDKLDR